MTVPGAAGPPERLARTREIGPFTLAGRVGVGRRTTAYIGQRSAASDPIVVRELHQHVDTEVFQAELMNAKGLVVGAPAEPLTRVGLACLATGPLIIGENLATILEDVISSQRPINHDLALAIAMGIARQLTLLSGIVHGDLAPHHVLIGYDGSIRLIDPAGDAYRERAQAPGRVGYRSPEHVRSHPLGPQSDVFLLGVLMFEMTTAHRLFDEATTHDTDARIVEGHVPRPRDVVGDGYPIEMQLVLRKLLRPAPSGRFTDANAARDALRLVATTRTEVSAEHIGTWLRARYHQHHMAWRELVGDLAGDPVREEPTVALKRPPSRAKTKITTKSAPPAHRSLNLDDPAMENVKKQIEALEVEARALVASRDRADTTRLKQELRALEEQSSGVRSHSSTIPDGPTQTRPIPLPRDPTIPDPKEQTLDEALEHLLQRDTEPLKRKRSQRPLELIPDLPTEVTPKRERPDTIQDTAPILRARADGDAVTPLDEIPAADDLLLPEPPRRGSTLQTHPEFGGGDQTEPSDPDRPTERPDLDLLESEPMPLPPASQPRPISARDLSADLVLDEGPSDTYERAFAEVLTADLLEPLPELAGEDTIQDHDAENLLGQGVVELMASVSSTPPPLLSDPPKQRQSRIDTQIIRERDVRTPQSEIETHVVREQIEDSDIEDVEPIMPVAELPSLPMRDEAPYEGELPPTVQTPVQTPVQATKPHDVIDDGASIGELVIPISDDELARSRRKRWSMVAMVLFVPLVVVATASIYLAGEQPAKVQPIEASQLELERPPPSSDPEALIEPAAPMPDASVAADAEPVEVAEEPPPPPPASPQPAKQKPIKVEQPAVTRVRVRALPEEAIIVVDGDFEIDNGGVVEVKDKPVKVIARANGWEEKSETIEPGRTKDVLLLLKKADTN